ncbi:ricin-type beta-trefoil lectin domain protein [Streptomyces platensis]|uniref:ricin-type beta-trefoil lectin domain protein n=1 Tax=Streptomyces platensis TaxID=58346 RepID=UPI0033CBF63B
MSLAVGASPLATGTAYADDNTAISRLSISPSEPQGAHGPMQLAIGDSDGLAVVDGELPHGWNLLPNKDGSFAMRMDPLMKCADVNNDFLTRVPCDKSKGTQNWYLQGNDGDGYRIRNVSNNKCMDVREVKNYGKVGLWDCGQGSKNQIWHLSPAQPGGTGPTVADLATEYALKQCSSQSSIVKSCDYEVTGDEKATVAPVKIVRPRQKNSSTSVAQRTITWTDTSTRTHTVGGSITITAEIGVNIAVVNAKVSNAISAHYSHTWTDQTTVSDAKTIDVNPGEYSWAVRGQLMKKITGKWTFTNDVGEKWSGSGTALQPVPDGTDDAKEVMAYCTSDSPDPECVATRE